MSNFQGKRKASVVFVVTAGLNLAQLWKCVWLLTPGLQWLVDVLQPLVRGSLGKSQGSEILSVVLFPSSVSSTEVLCVVLSMNEPELFSALMQGMHWGSGSPFWLHPVLSPFCHPIPLQVTGEEVGRVAEAVK